MCCKENEENFHFCTWRFSIEPEVDRRWGRISSLAYSISLLFRNCNNVICNRVHGEDAMRRKPKCRRMAATWRAVRLGDGFYKQYFGLNRRGMERKCVEKCTWLTHCDKQTCSIIRKYNKGIRIGRRDQQAFKRIILWYCRLIVSVLEGTVSSWRQSI